MSSPSHFKINTTILLEKNVQNSKFYFFIYDPKLHKKHLQDLKKLRKAIFSDFQSILDQNLILKKKSPEIWSEIGKNPMFLKFQLWVCGQNRSEIGRYVAGRSTQVPSLPPIFFIRNGQKFMIYPKKHTPQKGPFFGGGGANFMYV